MEVVVDVVADVVVGGVVMEIVDGGIGLVESHQYPCEDLEVRPFPLRDLELPYHLYCDLE